MTTFNFKTATPATTITTGNFLMGAGSQSDSTPTIYNAVSVVSTASTLVARDANQNAFANNFVSKATNVTSAGGTTTLTAASTRIQNLTGSANQTFKLPDATTLAVGAQFQFNNNSTGTLSVTDNGNNAICTVPFGGIAIVLAIAVATSNGSWESHFLAPSNVQWGTNSLTFPAGTTAIAPYKLQAGTNLTSAAAGAAEFDGVQFYNTIDTTSGRGAVPVEQYFHLAANGGTISTIANFFGANSNISLVASAYYIIDIHLWFTVATQGTVTWTLTNSAAPTSQNIYYEMSPVPGGIVAPPGTATMLVGQVNNDATAAKTVTTGTINDATTNYAHFKIWLKNGTGTSLLVQATKNVGGTLTPQLNSYWIARRMSPNNIGTFAA